MSTLYCFMLMAWRAGARSWKRWRVMVADRRAFAQLDESSLRDLGISRSDIHSFRVDAQAVRPTTRRQLAK
ncbi:DUF1127 domain-containing protein [Variovorax sp. KK3]|uniref:DUF1127 domain-containing protein n=1 Tax=Variovorax sp. KK3 TaxID=1855728 RepID=UPI00097BBD1F|nr:DUF1127 domain-containing protein [Variovorax sp. KK3]